MSGAMIKGLY